MGWGGWGVVFSRDFVPPVAGPLFKISTVFENVTLVFVNVYAQLNKLFAWIMVYSSKNGLNSNEFLKGGKNPNLSLAVALQLSERRGRPSGF